MKKISELMKIKTIHRNKLLFLKKTRKTKINTLINSSLAKKIYDEIQRNLPQTKWRKAERSRNESKRFIFFDAPEIFSFTENYAATLSFLMEFRKAFYEASKRLNFRRKNIYADFSKIKEIEPAAGLALAAEIYRWSKWQHRKPKLNGQKWQKNVRDFFKHAGLYELLNVNPPSKDLVTNSGEHTNFMVLKYRTGKLTDGSIVKQLKEELEHLSGISITKNLMFQAMCEAMNNVKHHAYKEELIHTLWPEQSICENWWAYGIWMPQERKIKIVILDQVTCSPSSYQLEVESLVS